MSENNHADFTPTLGTYHELKPFRYWCQKVLPLVYDDSLSYYELLSKVLNTLNQSMEDIDTLHDDVDNLHTAYEQLQEYVNTYFDDLDIQDVINNKLDTMADDGTLSALIAPLVPDAVTDWLDENITPTTPVVDSSLTVSGAAADAKVTGDNITLIDKTLGAISEETDNLLDPIISSWINHEMLIYTFPTALPAGTYTCFLNAHTDREYLMRAAICSTETYASRIQTHDFPQNQLTRYVFTSNVAIKSFYLLAGRGSAEYTGATLTVDFIGLVSGDVTDMPYPHWTAVDFIARSTDPLAASGGTDDRTLAIQKLLTDTDVCELGVGDFYVTGLNMPDGTTLKGQGSQTRLILTDSSADNAVNMGDKCSVQDLTICGSLTNINLDGDMLGIADHAGTTNLWLEGDVTTDSAGFSHIVLSEPLPAGSYRVTTKELRTDGGGMGYIMFSTDPNGSIGGDNIIGRINVPANTVNVEYITLDRAAYSVRLSSVQVANSGVTSEWVNTKISAVGGRSGISWTGTDKYYGLISNVWINNFDCAGIFMQDTTQDTDHALSISNCFITQCNAGIYVRMNSEFHRISNCVITKNYYGYLCRGGNNNVDNCGLDNNVVNCQLDADEGTNTGHGAINNCSMNHADNNTGNSLVIKTTGRMLIGNCNFYYGNIELDTTNGNIITGCGFGSKANWTVKDSNCNIFNGCIVRSWNEGDTTVTITNSPNTKIINCFSRSGAQYA